MFIVMSEEGFYPRLEVKVGLLVISVVNGYKLQRRDSSLLKFVFNVLKDKVGSNFENSRVGPKLS